MEDFSRKINLVVAFRAFMIPLISATIYFTKDFVSPQPSFGDTYYALMAFFFVLNVFWKYLADLPDPAGKAILFGQILGDLTLVFFTVYFTEGAETPFALLYILVIMYASLFLDFRGIIIVTALACLSNITTLAFLLYGNAHKNPAIAIKPFLLSMEVSVLGNVIVGLLMGFLAERLRHAHLRVEQQTTRIRDLNEYNTLILDNIRSGLLTTDKRFKVVKVNQTGVRLLETQEESILGGNALAIFRLNEDEIAHISFPPQEQRAIRLEKWLEEVGPDGLFIGLSISPILVLGELDGYIFIFQDLTEIKKLENELEIQRRMAAIGSLSAAIAHEVRNPLASMSGSIQVLKDHLNLQDSHRQLMDIVLRESQRLDRIISDFLQFAGFRKFSPKEIDAVSLIRETILLLENSPEFKPEHRIQLETEHSAIVMSADPDQLRQVVWNLCSNAMKAMPSGGAISIACTRENRHVRLVFRDEGRGMKEDELAHLFEPFQSHFPSGIGLGMAIVYRIVTDHGGRIEVHSIPEKGTVFTLWFPLIAKQPLPRKEVSR